jgi:membrane-associated phospholipid phosphatase
MGTRLCTSAIVAALALSACQPDGPTSPAASAPDFAAVSRSESGSSIAWNATARGLIAARSIAAPHVQLRILTYLSVAQYNAVVAAEDTKDRGTHASLRAAAAAASVVVLSHFFPLDAADLEDDLDAQLAAPAWPGERHRDISSGEAVGRSVGASVVTYAQSDNFNLAAIPALPTGEHDWKSSTNPATPSVKALWGTRPFVMESPDQFRPDAPPAFGSPEFTAALMEIRNLSDNRTPEQLALAQFYAPRAPTYMNEIAAELIHSYGRTERESARVLALANMAGFDAMIGCWDAKFAYWLLRPWEADPAITTPIGRPNHPSYLSGHSCNTSSFATVLADAFPSERERLEGIVVAAGLSRMYAGLHYRFDCEDGQALGRQVGNLVLSTAPVGHEPIPLD